MRAAHLLLLLPLAAFGTASVRSAAAAPPRSPDVVSGAWVEDRDGKPTLVVALYRRAESTGPAKAFVGCSTSTDQDGPGGYGVIAKDAWTEVALGAGVLVRAERPLSAAEQERPPAVLVAPAAATAPVDVHTLIDGSVPEGALLFARPTRSTQVTLSRHVLEVGQTAEVVLAAPPDAFFLPETLEVVVVSRRLGIDSDDADGPAGHVRLAWLAPEGVPPAPAQELSGAAGERRLRAHFTDPTCAWAERHVGWMEPRWVLELVRPTELRFRVETDAVKRPGTVQDVWKGWGALSLEAIYPNGFGGSSANLELPPLLIVPKGTKVRSTPLRRGP